jgi:hypothetical protein
MSIAIIKYNFLRVTMGNRSKVTKRLGSWS